MKYTAKDAACYADGLYGNLYTERVLGELVDDLGHSHLANDLINGGMGDDRLSTINEALDILNEVTEGAFWEFVDGDLMLTAENSDEQA